MTISSHSHRHRVPMVLMCILAMLAACGCKHANSAVQSEIETGQTANSQAIIKPVEEAPLLRLEDDAEPETASGPAADNSRCLVCHINYAEEQIAASHALQNFGCAHCHGPSDAHIADESWGSGGNGTAPDIMYPRETIDPACMTCHPKEKIDTPQHRAIFAGSNAKVCTDCHGKHRLSVRRCKWR